MSKAVKALVAVKNFYVTPWKESKGRNIALFFFVMGVIAAAAIVFCYYYKGANKLFMRDGMIGRQFHNANGWKAITVTVLAVGVGSLLMLHTIVSALFHRAHKKKPLKVEVIGDGASSSTPAAAAAPASGHAPIPPRQPKDRASSRAEDRNAGRDGGIASEEESEVEEVLQAGGDIHVEEENGRDINIDLLFQGEEAAPVLAQPGWSLLDLQEEWDLQLPGRVKRGYVNDNSAIFQTSYDPAISHYFMSEKGLEAQTLSYISAKDHGLYAEVSPRDPRKVTVNNVGGEYFSYECECTLPVEKVFLHQNHLVVVTGRYLEIHSLSDQKLVQRINFDSQFNQVFVEDGQIIWKTSELPGEKKLNILSLEGELLRTFKTSEGYLDYVGNGQFLRYKKEGKSSLHSLETGETLQVLDYQLPEIAHERRLHNGLLIDLVKEENYGGLSYHPCYRVRIMSAKTGAIINQYRSQQDWKAAGMTIEGNELRVCSFSPEQTYWAGAFNGNQPLDNPNPMARIQRFSLPDPDALVLDLDLLLPNQERPPLAQPEASPLPPQKVIELESENADDLKMNRVSDGYLSGDLLVLKQAAEEKGRGDRNTIFTLEGEGPLVIREPLISHGAPTIKLVAVDQDRTVVTHSQTIVVEKEGKRVAKGDNKIIVNRDDQSLYESKIREEQWPEQVILRGDTLVIHYKEGIEIHSLRQKKIIGQMVVNGRYDRCFVEDDKIIWVNKTVDETSEIKVCSLEGQLMNRFYGTGNFYYLGQDQFVRIMENGKGTLHSLTSGEILQDLDYQLPTYFCEISLHKGLLVGLDQSYGIEGTNDRNIPVYRVRMMSAKTGQLLGEYQSERNWTRAGMAITGDELRVCSWSPIEVHGDHRPFARLSENHNPLARIEVFPLILPEAPPKKVVKEMDLDLLLNGEERAPAIIQPSAPTLKVKAQRNLALQGVESGHVTGNAAILRLRGSSTVNDGNAFQHRREICTMSGEGPMTIPLEVVTAEGQLSAASEGRKVVVYEQGQRVYECEPGEGKNAGVLNKVIFYQDRVVIHTDRYIEIHSLKDKKLISRIDCGEGYKVTKLFVEDGKIIWQKMGGGVQKEKSLLQLFSLEGDLLTSFTSNEHLDYVGKGQFLRYSIDGKSTLHSLKTGEVTQMLNYQLYEYADERLLHNGLLITLVKNKKSFHQDDSFKISILSAVTGELLQEYSELGWKAAGMKIEGNKLSVCSFKIKDLNGASNFGAKIQQFDLPVPEVAQ